MSMTKRIVSIESDLTKIEYTLDDGRSIIGYEQVGRAEITETQVRNALDDQSNEGRSFFDAEIQSNKKEDEIPYEQDGGTGCSFQQLIGWKP
jgi:hypothetical protein